VCSKEKFPEVFEDLVITGAHSILVDTYKPGQREKTLEVLGGYYSTASKIRLPACVDDRTTIFNVSGSQTIYHLALENDNYTGNFGIYANGLLVESCSIRYLREKANMTLVE